jgi:Methyltransferase domain
MFSWVAGLVADFWMCTYTLAPSWLGCACAGKWMCDANRTLAQEPCIVLSMGSNGQTDFETAILQRAPHCRVTWPSDVVLLLHAGAPQILHHAISHSCAQVARLECWMSAAVQMHALPFRQAAHCAAQVHTYDHTLHPAVQAAVASIPGVEFHSMGLTG